jgi:hypothetical protein
MRNTRGVNTSIPSAIAVRVQLKRLDNGRLQRLSELSGVPFTTLWKCRSGETTNPGIETVRKFAPYIDAAAGEEVKAA